MASNNPIILIEDDTDDQELFAMAIKDLGVTRPLHTFSDCKQALVYLNATDEQPFLIFCDINQPYMSGLEFKQLIDADPYLRKKSIPFVFYSTAANEAEVNKAYNDMTIQGFFVKPHGYRIKLDLIKRILDYWEVCKHPNA